MSKYADFSGPNTEKYRPEKNPYLDTFQFSPNTEKYGPEKTPYLDTFHVLGFKDILFQFDLHNYQIIVFNGTSTILKKGSLTQILP